MLPVGPDPWPPGPDVFAARSVKSMIPNDFIQTLLSRIEIVDVIDRYVPLKKAGATQHYSRPDVVMLSDENAVTRLRVCDAQIVGRVSALSLAFAGARREYRARHLS